MATAPNHEALGSVPRAFVVPWIDGRGGAIRTLDLLNPIQVRYQAAPRPDENPESNRSQAGTGGSQTRTASSARRRGLFGDDPVGVGEGVLPDASDLPADPLAGRPAGDGEATLADLGLDMEARRRGAERGQLVADVPVEGLEVGRQVDPRLTSGVEADDAVVDVLHVGALDEAVGQVSLGGILGVVDPEPATALGQEARHVDGTGEVGRPAGRRDAVDADPARGMAGHPGPAARGMAVHPAP